MDGHEVLHIAVLSSTIMGAAGLALLVLWPVIFETRPAPTTIAALVASVALAGLLFLVEWLVVH
ncbi:MAG: hypothetical protein M3238_07025 [Actinomycetota bacterium]|nr:hypothetical protein [Actinomycetota bacterium]